MNLFMREYLILPHFKKIYNPNPTSDIIVKITKIISSILITGETLHMTTNLNCLFKLLITLFGNKVFNK